MKNAATTGNSGKFTFLHRLLHWATAIAMTVLYITGFLRMTWMNRHEIAGIIGEKAGDALSKEVVREIAITIREPMWDWHVVFAYVMTGAFLARIIYMLAKGIRFPAPFRRDTPLGERFQGLTYVYFYAFVLVQVVTGFCLYLSLFPEWKKGIEGVHKWGLWLFPVFIVLHAAGVMLAEYSDQRGITSRMIGGDGPPAKR